VKNQLHLTCYWVLVNFSCAYGEGYYAISAAGTTIVSGQLFSESEVVNFTLGSTNESIGNWTSPGNDTDVALDVPEDIVAGEAEDDVDRDSVADATSKLVFRVDFHYDYYPSETQWTLRDVGTKEKLLQYPYNSVEEPGAVISEYVDLRPGSTYKLKISDLYGDGICCSHSTGFGYAAVFAVDADGVDVPLEYVDGEFSSVTVHKFTIPDNDSSDIV